MLAPPALQFDRILNPSGDDGVISLGVAPGEFVTVLGAPGSGKTRLLRLAAGLDRPRAGAVLVEAGRPERLRRAGALGMVWQGEALLPQLTVRRNLGFPLAVSGRWGGRWSRSGRAARRGQVALVAELLDLSGLLERLPGQLDTGQRRRVALARAVVGEPRLLLLDEPLASLDPQARDGMQVALRRTHDWLGATTLAVTGEPDDALSLSDRIAVLGPSGIAQTGSPGTLYEQPADAAVAGAFGPTNRLPGRIQSVEDDLALVRLDCGPLVEARLVETAMAAQLGDACLLVVRPERIAVAAISPEEMGEEMSDENGRGAIAATLIEALDLGDQLRLRFLVGSGAAITVLRPAAAGLGGLAPGRTASIAFQPYHAVVFLG